MKRRARARRALPALALATSLASSCAPSPANGVIDVQLVGLAGATATLSVEDDDGAPAVFDVKDFAGELHRASGVAELECVDNDDGVVCSAGLVLDPGAYRFTLAVAQRDRCGASATTVSLSSGEAPIELQRGPAAAIRFAVARADFDDDGDGIVNALERVVCGRFDVEDGALPPRSCVDGDPCCTSSSSPLQGQRSVFPGGPHDNALGQSVDVAPFALDATELTWRAFSRCVAAGACLSGQPEHAVRKRLDDPALDEDLPVTGLLPREAADLCAWHGGRLPDDDEWDFAAADRGSAPRGVYPFDVPKNVDAQLGGIGCVEGEDAIAVNHAARGRSCPDEPVPVGSYPSTFVTRGVGSALADLAGNAAEWTVRRGTGAPADGASGDDGSVVSTSGPFPDGVVEVDVRGGSAGGIVELLENDVVLRVTSATTNAEQRVRALAATTGVRCAFDVTDVDALDAAAALVEEPACGAKP